MKIIAAVFFALFFANLANAQALDEDCDCTAPAYVNYFLLDEYELDDIPWEVVEVKLDTQGQDEQCWVTIQPSDRPYNNGPHVPDGEFAIHDGNFWMLASDFEAQMSETACSLVPTS